MEYIENFLEWGGMRKKIVLLVISGIMLMVSIFNVGEMPFDAAWIAVVLCGLPIVLEAIVGLITKFDIKADVLVSMALVASLVIGEYFAAGEVAFIMMLGALLEDLTVAKARAGIEKLVKLTPRTARVIRDGEEFVVASEKVREGDLLRVLPGEIIAVDGIIENGQTSINQAVITGESLPVDKERGDEVSSGSVNMFGSFDMIATKAVEDSSIQRMIKLVESADAGKAKIVGIADRWATWIVVAALLAAVITWVVTGEIIRSVTILVVFCPCALVLATPTAIMAAIGNATKHGFLIGEGDALERLSSISKITFDKTGTLTTGQPQVIYVHSFDGRISEKDIFYFGARAEVRSEHPLGKAVVRSFNECHEEKAVDSEEFQMVPGMGVVAKAAEKEIIAGNKKLLEVNNIGISEEDEKAGDEFLGEGATLIYIGIDGKLAGFIALSDSLRKDSKEMIENIKAVGVCPVLLTGDNENSARHMGEALGIEAVISGCLPEDKLNYVERSQGDGEKVCMIGDGINDAPALKKAHVGIAMGGIGSDIAVDAADIVLIDDEIKEFPHLLQLSKRMMVSIKCNLTFSMSLNVVAVILAITGVLNPVVGALVHNAGSVLVITNSAFLLRWKKRK